MNTVLYLCLSFYRDATLFLTLTPLNALEVEPVLCPGNDPPLCCGNRVGGEAANLSILSGFPLHPISKELLSEFLRPGDVPEQLDGVSPET